MARKTNKVALIKVEFKLPKPSKKKGFDWMGFALAVVSALLKIAAWYVTK